MSRGRADYRRGRGGRGGKMGGADMPWEYDPEVKVDYKPSELFPEVRQAVPATFTARERAQVARFRTLRDRIHEGPLYTVLGDNNSRVTKPGAAPTRVMVDPFEGMPTYTQKYRKRTRKVPRLDTRPYVLRFFPKELWSTLDPDHAMQDDDGSDARHKTKKTLKIGMSSQGKSALDAGDALQNGEQALVSRPPGTVIKAEPDDEDEDEAVARGGAHPDEDLEGAEEEDEDDNYESDEFETAGDYNAEEYFDDGEDDGGGDDFDDGGGDEGPVY